MWVSWLLCEYTNKELVDVHDKFHWVVEWGYDVSKKKSMIQKCCMTQYFICKTMEE